MGGEATSACGLTIAKEELAHVYLLVVMVPWVIVNFSKELEALGLLSSLWEGRTLG